MKNTLVIKTGASGDVVRTTTILHVLEGDIYWITDPYNFPVFPDDHRGLRLISKDEIPDYLYELSFELIINLEEDKRLAQMAGLLIYKKLTGVIFAEGSLSYTPDSGCWYNMSLISKLGKAAADDLKKSNKYSYQQLIFQMLGKQFEDQPYLVHDAGFRSRQKRIGIEWRAGHHWPNKSWHGFRQLGDRLTAEGYDVFYFVRRNSLREYLDEIRGCSLVVCGDSLAMHMALAYRIPAVTIFNCTSPAEIYDYGLLEKIVSPLIHDYYYDRRYSPEVISSVSVDSVYEAVKRKLRSE